MGCLCYYPSSYIITESYKRDHESQVSPPNQELYPNNLPLQLHSSIGQHQSPNQQHLEHNNPNVGTNYLNVITEEETIYNNEGVEVPEMILQNPHRQQMPVQFYDENQFEIVLTEEKQIIQVANNVYEPEEVLPRPLSRIH